MKCKNCNQEIQTESTFCPYCGEKAVSEDRKCSFCGAKLKLEDKYCENCGADVSQKQDATTEVDLEKEMKEKLQAKLDKIRSFFKSNLYLAILIVSTVSIGISAIANISSNNITGSVLPVLSLVGLWFVYLHAKDPLMHPKTGFAWIIIPTQISFILICVAVGIIFATSCTACSCALLADAGVGVITGGVLGIVLAILGFVILYYYKLWQFLKDAAITLEAGTPDYQKRFKFVYVMQWIFTVLSCIGMTSLLSMIGQVDLMNAMIQEYLRNLNLGAEFNEAFKELTFSFGVMSIIATVVETGAQVLYLIGLKKFDEHYRLLD